MGNFECARSGRRRWQRWILQGRVILSIYAANQQPDGIDLVPGNHFGIWSHGYGVGLPVAALEFPLQMALQNVRLIGHVTALKKRESLKSTVLVARRRFRQLLHRLVPGLEPWNALLWRISPRQRDIQPGCTQATAAKPSTGGGASGALCSRAEPWNKFREAPKRCEKSEQRFLSELNLRTMRAIPYVANYEVFRLWSQTRP